VFKEAARKKDISVEVNVPEELTAFADEKMLSSVLRNLISNAIKFTPRGGKVGIKAFAYENQSVEVCTSDNGVGISPDDIQRLFRIDEKVNSPGTENESSTGLGLILCKEFVEKMGGRIWANSLENKGSDFYFTLPAPQKEENKNEKSVQDNISINEPMLLVAEDEDISFMVMKNFLKKTPIHLIRAKDGQEAVELCKRYPEIMLVLMDINMPVMNGFEATIKIKAFRKGLPVIAVTAYTSENAVEDAVKAGCDDFVSKPVTKETISAKLAMFGLNVI
jgi:CheY-like chemotaxis protein